MILFKTREPRRYHHTYMYIDERKEKLKAIEDRAKRELGLLPPKEFSPEDIRGTFVKGTKHLRRRKEGGRKPMRFGVALIIIGVLLFIWHYLLTGSFRF
ncbi:hypothetical protein [Bacteroides acidifaciens]|uniref:hypothetical protein n=1 Tax=Bacteroides acidifaciens TaxID=85831 RepID=UPI0030152E4D